MSSEQQPTVSESKPIKLRAPEERMKLFHFHLLARVEEMSREFSPEVGNHIKQLMTDLVNLSAEEYSELLGNFLDKKNLSQVRRDIKNFSKPQKEKKPRKKRATKAKTEPEAESKPETDADAESKPEPEAESKPEPEPEPAPEAPKKKRAPRQKKDKTLSASSETDE